MTTKIHALVDALGNPVEVMLSPGQDHDLTCAEPLIEAVDPGALIADKAFDAALLLSRAACDALIEDAIEHGRTYARARTLVGNTDTSVHYDVFRVGVHNNEYLSEDYWVCRRLRTLGFDVLIDPTIVTTHVGSMPV